MRPASLIASTSIMMLTSWLSLTYAYRSKSIPETKATTANFNVRIDDEEGRPVPNHAVRLDGRFIGKTNKMGTIAEQNINIGNMHTIVLSIKSTEFNYDTPREITLSLPKYESSEPPHYTINATICVDFEVCDEDRFSIGLSPPTGTKSEAKPEPAMTLVESNTYNFKLIRSKDHGPKISTIISELERIQLNRKAAKDGRPVNVTFSYIGSNEYGQMLRVIGKKTGASHNEFALLLPLKPQLQDLAKDVATYLADLSPEKTAAKSRKPLKMKFQQPLSSNYEVYAGGVSGEPVTPDSWSLAVPASGKFFLTIVKKGEIIARKFLDVGDAEQFEFDTK